MKENNFDYKNRIADRILSEKLEGMGAVLVKGPKWCGKTTTAEQRAKSVIYIDTPENVEENIKISEINPTLLLEGDTPRLIDEWQITPKLWDAVRFTVDRRKKDGQFILTGSSVPVDSEDEKERKTRHSGTGRIAQITMRPMSLWESGDSSGSVSIRRLFEGMTDISGINDKNIEDLAFLICRGGWPRAVTQKKKHSTWQGLRLL